MNYRQGTDIGVDQCAIQVSYKSQGDICTLAGSSCKTSRSGMRKRENGKCHVPEAPYSLDTLHIKQACPASTKAAPFSISPKR